MWKINVLIFSLCPEMLVLCRINVVLPHLKVIWYGIKNWVPQILPNIASELAKNTFWVILIVDFSRLIFIGYTYEICFSNFSLGWNVTFIGVISSIDICTALTLSFPVRYLLSLFFIELQLFMIFLVLFFLQTTRCHPVLCLDRAAVCLTAERCSDANF